MPYGGDRRQSCLPFLLGTALEGKMRPEQLDEIEKLAEARLRVGDALADRLLLTINALRESQAEITRLRRLLGEIP